MARHESLGSDKTTLINETNALNATGTLGLAANNCMSKTLDTRLSLCSLGYES